MKYKIETLTVIYGGPWSDKDFKIKLEGLTLIEVIKKIEEMGILENIEFNAILSTPEDSMGCCMKVRVTEDRSPDTIFKALNAEEKRKLFEFAESWIENEMTFPDELIRKIKMVSYE